MEENIEQSLNEQVSDFFSELQDFKGIGTEAKLLLEESHDKSI